MFCWKCYKVQLAIFFFLLQLITLATQLLENKNTYKVSKCIGRYNDKAISWMPTCAKFKAATTPFISSTTIVRCCFRTVRVLRKTTSENLHLIWWYKSSLCARYHCYWFTWYYRQIALEYWRHYILTWFIPVQTEVIWTTFEQPLRNCVLLIIQKNNHYLFNDFNLISRFFCNMYTQNVLSNSQLMRIYI